MSDKAWLIRRDMDASSVAPGFEYLTVSSSQVTHVIFWRKRNHRSPRVDRHWIGLSVLLYLEQMEDKWRRNANHDALFRASALQM